MLNKLAAVEARLLEVEDALQQSDLYSDPKRAADLLREQKELAPVVEAYRRYKAAEADLQTAQELLRDEDPDIRDMAFMDCLSSFRRILYLGRYFFIRLHSSARASLSESVIIYSKS
ncbi:MAG: PCRF domain-containing protein [Clostridia bacterium]|nr:PCRF domain-containing protein [Clostridia bacterium]